MLFADSSMARIQSKVIRPSPTATEQTYFQIKGSVFSVMDTVKAIHADGSKPGRAAAKHRDAEDLRDWCGFRGQTLADAFDTGSITAAIEDFKKAQSKMVAPLTRGKLDYSPVGGSFNTGRFLTGHPICMYNRQKTKLPPKTIELVIRCSANLPPSALAAPLVKIIRATWAYQNAGGLVTLTVHYFHTFSRVQVWNDTPHRGLITSINIPLSNPGILATAASVQFYRGVSMPLACYLSGEFGDGLPVCDWTGPGLYGLKGLSSDSAALEALAIS